ncbi:hypothetical protein A2U01_0090840, partial [Trifolium medium]|nr:hypothetical protein [Trifolium medium]
EPFGAPDVSSTLRYLSMSLRYGARDLNEDLFGGFQKDGGQIWSVVCEVSMEG